MAKAINKEPEVDVSLILDDKTIKAKQKTKQLAQMLIEETITIDALIRTANDKEKDKAILIEAMEYASKIQPAIINNKGFEFVVRSLKDDAPAVKRESARVIANTAHMFPKLLQKAVAALLPNTEHKGTVVRWSAAGALGKIMQCSSALNKGLVPAIEALLQWEEDNAIRKIYEHALKKVNQHADKK